MSHNLTHEADWAIGATILGAGAYDVWAMATGHETISSAVRRHTERPWQKFMMCAAMGGLILHFLSEDTDPFRLSNYRMEQQ